MIIKSCNIAYIKGAATTELLLSLIIFVPLFLGVPLLGKYQSVKQKTIESNRYAVWERTVWADGDGRWNDDENIKSDENIVREVDQRFYGSQIQGLAISSITDNNLWTDVNNKNLLVAAPKGKHRISVKLSSSDSPVGDRMTDNIAFRGVPIVGKPLDKFTEVIGTTLGQFVSTCENAPGVDLKHGMNLGYKTYAGIVVTAQYRNELKRLASSTKEQNKLAFSSQGSILSNTWVAPSETVFHQRVDQLVVDEAITCIASPAELLAYFPVYKEGRDAGNVVSSEKSTVLLETYLP